ncbi:MAG TPA: tRNA lysidine(34) synthetase TilS, partial [Bacteroidota bacterium]|nr:tRNA lysidine(34) synthetase TilS [Bacteroidota bacterium]
SRGATGSFLTLGNTVNVYKDRDRLVMTTIRPPRRYLHPIELNKRHEFNTFSFESTTVNHADMTGNPSVEYIDSSLLGKNLILRSWQEGDWFIPLGMSTKKKISDFFIDAKVPVFEKNSIPLLVSDDQIVWVCGKRLDNRYKVTAKTRFITKLEYLPRS